MAYTWTLTTEVSYLDVVEQNYDIYSQGGSLVGYCEKDQRGADKPTYLLSTNEGLKEFQTQGEVEQYLTSHYTSH